MRRLLVAAVALAALAAGPANAATGDAGGVLRDDVLPTNIALPDDFHPTGIAIDGITAYVGSLTDGAIVRQDLLDGVTTPFASSPGAHRMAAGLDVDRHGRLWVAGGGPTRDPRVTPVYRIYDTRNGGLLTETALSGAGFVHDVVVTDRAAWFTDAWAPRLIRVPLGSDGSIGHPELVTLYGDWTQAEDAVNATGIVATPDGRTLLVAQATTPEQTAAVHNVPAHPTATRLGSRMIELDRPLPGADGLALVGLTLYAVAGAAGVAKLQLARGMRHAEVIDTLPVPGAGSPAAVAALGGRLYVVETDTSTLDDPAVTGVSFATTAIRR